MGAFSTAHTGKAIRTVPSRLKPQGPIVAMGQRAEVVLDFGTCPHQTLRLPGRLEGKGAAACRSER
jgi:hypothetical protein